MRIRAIAVALILLVGMSSSFAAPSPKAGATCTKLGITQNFQGKKFTCVKSGSKRVWDKGTAIKSALPSPTPTNPKGKIYSVQMAKAHLPVAPANGYDDYRCFLLDPKVTEDSIIQSIEFIPQRKNYVHHAIIFRVSEANLQEAKTLDASGTGWPCFGGSGLGGMFTSFVTSPWISAWAPGRGKTCLQMDMEFHLRKMSSLFSKFITTYSPLRAGKSKQINQRS